MRTNRSNRQNHLLTSAGRPGPSAGLNVTANGRRGHRSVFRSYCPVCWAVNSRLRQPAQSDALLLEWRVSLPPPPHAPAPSASVLLPSWYHPFFSFFRPAEFSCNLGVSTNTMYCVHRCTRICSRRIRFVSRDRPHSPKAFHQYSPSFSNSALRPAIASPSSTPVDCFCFVH